MQLGAGGTTGSIVGNVSNNGALAFNRSDTYTYGGTISGTGSATQQGNGTTILTANNTYTGGTTVDAGSLYVRRPDSRDRRDDCHNATLGGKGVIGGNVTLTGNSNHQRHGIGHAAGQRHHHPDRQQYLHWRHHG